MLRHCYMRFVGGSSSKEYLLFVSRIDDTFVTKAFYGRIGAGGSQKTEKYRGVELGRALAAYDKVQHGKLREGYRDSDEYRRDHALIRILREHGATARDIEPRLAFYHEPESLTVTEAREAGILPSPGWRWYRRSDDHWLVAIGADQIVQMMKTQGNVAAVFRNDRYFSPNRAADELVEAGMLPAAFEITYLDNAYHVLDVHQIRGLMAELPGEQRLMLCQELIDAMPTKQLSMTPLIGNVPPFSLPAAMTLYGTAGALGIELGGMRRVVITGA